MTLSFVLFLVLMSLLAIVLIMKPIWTIAFGVQPGGFTQAPCRLCGMAQRCSAMLEVTIGFISLCMGTGLSVTPGVMTTNTSWESLIVIAPQPFWATAATLIGVLQVVAAVQNSLLLRGIATYVGLLWWSRLAYSAALFWPQGIGFFLFGSLALIAAAALMSFSWEMGQIEASRKTSPTRVSRDV